MHLPRVCDSSGHREARHSCPVPGHLPMQGSRCRSSWPGTPPAARPKPGCHSRECFSQNRPVQRCPKEGKGLVSCPGFLPGLPHPPCLCYLWIRILLFACSCCRAAGKGSLSSQQSHSSFLKGLTIWLPPLIHPEISSKHQRHARCHIDAKDTLIS